MPYYINTSKGFLSRIQAVFDPMTRFENKTCFYHTDLRQALPFNSFAEADAMGKKLPCSYFAIVVPAIK